MGTVSASFEQHLEKDAASERAVGHALARELADSSCLVVADVRCPATGDVDYVVVGPGGVTVIDVKHWTGRISASNGVLRSSGRNQKREVRKLWRQRMAVRLTLGHARPELRNLNVAGLICLSSDESRAKVALEDGLLLSGPVAAAAHAAREGDLRPAQIAEIAEVIRVHLASVTNEQIDGRAQAPRESAPAPVATVPVLPAPAIPAAPAAAVAPVTPTPIPAPSPLPRPVAAPHPRRASRSRRAPRQRSFRLDGRLGAWPLFAALVCVVVAVAVPLYLDQKDSTPTVPAPGLHVGRHTGRAIVYLTAPADARVEVRIIAGRSTHFTHLTGRGALVHWLVPRGWSRAPWITVSACVVGTTGRCAGPSAMANDQP